MNIPSISEDKNYMYAKSTEVQKLIQNALGCTFENNLCITDKLILRKEILKALYEAA